MILTSILFLTLISEPTEILFVGDSLTAGYGLKEEDAYPALLEKKFSEKDLPVKILNGGVSGDTTAGGLRRLSWMLKNSSPRFVVIALGGNDMLRGLPPEDTKKNLKEMIHLLKKEKIEVAVFGIEAPANLGSRFVNRFNSIYKELEKEEKVPVLENYISDVAGRSQLNLADGIHPNQEGQKKIAEKVFKFLFPFISRLDEKK